MSATLVSHRLLRTLPKVLLLLLLVQFCSSGQDGVREVTTGVDFSVDCTAAVTYTIGAFGSALYDQTAWALTSATTSVQNGLQNGASSLRGFEASASAKWDSATQTFRDLISGQIITNWFNENFFPDNNNGKQDSDPMFELFGNNTTPAINSSSQASGNFSLMVYRGLGPNTTTLTLGFVFGGRVVALVNAVLTTKDPTNFPVRANMPISYNMTLYMSHGTAPPLPRRCHLP